MYYIEASMLQKMYHMVTHKGWYISCSILASIPFECLLKYDTFPAAWLLKYDTFTAACSLKYNTFPAACLLKYDTFPAACSL